MFVFWMSTSGKWENNGQISSSLPENKAKTAQSLKVYGKKQSTFIKQSAKNTTQELNVIKS